MMMHDNDYNDNDCNNDASNKDVADDLLHAMIIDGGHESEWAIVNDQ